MSLPSRRNRKPVGVPHDRGGGSHPPFVLRLLVSCEDTVQNRSIGGFRTIVC